MSTQAERRARVHAAVNAIIAGREPLPDDAGPELREAAELAAQLRERDKAYAEIADRIRANSRGWRV